MRRIFLVDASEDASRPLVKAVKHAFHSESREGGPTSRGLEGPFSIDSSRRWRDFPMNERDPVFPNEKYDNKLLFYEEIWLWMLSNASENCHQGWTK